MNKTYSMGNIPNEVGTELEILFNDQWIKAHVAKDETGCHILHHFSNVPLKEFLNCSWFDFKGFRFIKN